MKNKKNKIILTSISVFLLALASGYFLYGGVFGSMTLNKTSLTLDDGLVGHWTFDGADMINNVADASGQGNHGSLKGQTATSSVRGKIGQGLEFDGLDDYVNMGDVLDVGTGDFTASAWIRTSSTTPNQYIVEKFQSNTDSIKVVRMRAEKQDFQVRTQRYIKK